MDRPGRVCTISMCVLKMLRASGTVSMVAALAACSTAQPMTITSRGTFDLPAATTDQFGHAVAIAGVSGITMAPEPGETLTRRFLAVMDNSNVVLELAVTLAGDGAVLSAGVVRAIRLSETHDYEGIIATDASRGTVFVSDEDTPAIREFRLADGSLVRTLPTPAVYASRRPNFGFEALGGVVADSSPQALTLSMWTCNEEALTVDGSLSTASTGTVVRLQRYTVGDHQVAPGPQVAYQAEPLHGVPISGSRSGVADLVMLPDGRVLTLERSFALSSLGLFRTRIFAVDFTGTTDVSSMPGLVGQSYAGITRANGRKTLLYEGDRTNLEGLTLGPRLGEGAFSLLGVVDDGDPISVNRLVAFEIAGVGNVPLRRWPAER